MIPSTEYYANEVNQSEKDIYHVFSPIKGNIQEKYRTIRHTSEEACIVS